jgi:predicted dehydrogenase
LRVGIVGLGFGERVLLPAFRAAAGCEVVGVCSGARDRARLVAEQHGVPTAFPDWQALVADPGVDAVVVATPTALHDPIASAAFSVKKHVFCEKPLAATLESARAMTAAAAAAGTANMIDFEFPEMAAWRAARRIVASGTLGAIRSVRVLWHGETYANRLGLRSWKTLSAQGGGVLNEFVSHCFHYLEWLVGPVRQVWAAPASEFDREQGIDTRAVLSVALPDGVVASLSVETAAFPGGEHSVFVQGEDGTLLLINRRPDATGPFELLTATRRSLRFEPVALEGCTNESHDARIAATRRLADRFVAWAVAGAPARPDFQDGCRVQTLVDAAWRSRANGGGYPIAVPADGGRG